LEPPSKVSVVPASTVIVDDAEIVTVPVSTKKDVADIVNVAAPFVGFFT